MPITRISVFGASFEPPELKMLGGIFDEVWARVAPDFSGGPDEIEVVRMRLAMIILDLAKDGQLGALQIARTASRLIRQTSPRRNVNPSEPDPERNS
jgi:hypothetical protein